MIDNCDFFQHLCKIALNLPQDCSDTRMEDTLVWKLEVLITTQNDLIKASDLPLIKPVIDFCLRS